MNTVTKKDLIDRITARTGEKRAVVKRVVQEFLGQIGDNLAAGKRIEFRDFGVFETRLRAPRTAQNPKTLERVQVPGRPAVKFKPGRRLRESVGDGQSRIVEVRPKAQATARRSPQPEVRVRSGLPGLSSNSEARPKG